MRCCGMPRRACRSSSWWAKISSNAETNDGASWVGSARWWPRVTLTVTRDPVLAAAAPDLATFATPGVPKQAAGHRADPVTEDPPTFVSALDEIFAHQEELRLARRGVPQQRASS